MGGFEEWRDWLLRVCAACFYSALPPGSTEFCVNMVDLMQYLAPQMMNQKRPLLDLPEVTRRVCERAAWHQNVERDPLRPLVSKATVLMFDTPHLVPKNKAGTQRSRDATRTSGAPPYMDAALYDAVAPHERERLLLDASSTAPLACSTVWRSVSLRLQLYRCLTHALLHSPVADGQAVVIDDGVACLSARFSALYDEVVAHHDPHSLLSDYERHCLVHQVLVAHQHYSRFVLYSDRRFKRFLPSQVGEADIKVQAYIRRHNGAQRFLVVNQDTDLLFILLLHMERFLHGRHGELCDDPALQVWLDCRSPSDKQPESRPYRFVDIKALYYAVRALFATHFPAVRYPVETLCALVFSLQTDYTQKYHGCLGVSARVVWDTFSQLHNVAATPLLWNAASKPAQHPRELYGLLERAVEYDAVKERFWLDRRQWSRFNYYLCQQGVLSMRHRLQLYCGAPDRVIAPDELLVYAQEVTERVDAHCAALEAQLAQQQLALKRPADTTEDPAPHKRLKQSSRRVLRVACDYGAAPVEEMVVEEETMDDIFARPMATPGNDMRTFLAHNKPALDALARKRPPPRCGVPTPLEMHARLQRLAWYLGYCRHGWQDPLCGESCVAQSKGRAQWGWRRAPTDVANSTYNGAHYDPETRACSYYGVEETCDVI